MCLNKPTIRPAGESSEELEPSFLKNEASTGGSPVKDQKNQSYNDFEIEDFMQGYEMESSNMTSLMESDEERKSLRASASPFYPDKMQDKLKCSNSISVQNSIAVLRENGEILVGIKKLLDNLDTEEKNAIV